MIKKQDKRGTGEWQHLIASKEKRSYGPHIKGAEDMLVMTSSL